MKWILGYELLSAIDKCALLDGSANTCNIVGAVIMDKFDAKEM